MKKKLKYPPTYKHDPKIEPRPYWRYDRFASLLSGFVHDCGFATDVPYVRESQLMAGHKATVESHAADKERYERQRKRCDELRAGVQTPTSPVTLNEPARKPKPKKVNRTIDKGERATESKATKKGKKARRRSAPRKAKLKRKGQ